MPQVIVPDWVARNERRRQVIEDSGSGLSQTRYWNPLLRDIDPRMMLAWVGRVEGSEPGVVPYRWHLVRKGENAPDTYWAITTAGLGRPGEFREMGSDVLEILRRGDLWDPRVVADRDAAARRREASEERSRETTREARREDLAKNLKAMNAPGVSMSDTGWTYRKSGRRGRA